jgi:hypothetical protein
MIAASWTFARSVWRRRSTSSARRLATVVSRAPGERGTPSRGQRASARSTASCTQSSARSQSPDTVRRSILPVVAVYTLSILIGLALPAVAVALYCAIAVLLVVPFGALGRLFVRRA